MEAISRSIKNWISDVSRSKILLPRFQRNEVWTPSHVGRFLWAILRNRPLGFFLVLKVDCNNQPFQTRPIADSDEQIEECNEHLLDGQQRLVALWRSFHDNHESHSYYVEFQRGFDDGYDEIGVKAVAKNGRESHKIGEPKKEYDSGWLPLRILKPGEDSIADLIAWRDEITTPENNSAITALTERLRERFNSAIIPYLSLPQDTSSDEAIEVFIEINSSSVKLSAFDLAVAQMEEETSESLIEKVKELNNSVPAISDLEENVGDLVLKVQCLLEGKKPTYGNYKDLNFVQFNADWPNIVEGIRWSTQILDDLNIWNSQRLPTSVPLRVLPALHRHVPMSGHEHANAMKVVKKYLWWSFLTDRYERQANDRLKRDYDDLVGCLNNSIQVSRLEIFKSVKPDKNDVKYANWPTTRGILSRAILVAASLDGAKDIASNRTLRKELKYDHHHVYPKAALRRFNRDPERVLNCMLLEPLTNKEWSKKWPGDYLIEMVESSETYWSDPEAEVSNRLKTHLLPPCKLLNANEEDTEANLGDYYDKFIDTRLTLVLDRIKTLLNHGTLE